MTPPFARDVNGSPQSSRPATTRVVVAATLLLVAWIASAFVFDMWFWGLSSLRFAPPIAGLTLVPVLAALVPPVATRLTALADRFGDALVRRRGAVAMAGLAPMALAWLLPDRGLVVGDALLRRGTLETEVRAGLLYPQALPLELLLHVHLPRFFAEARLGDAVGAARWLGAFEAGLLAVLAAAFARVLGLRGAAATIVWAGVLCGGWLGLFTGYAKAFSELVLLVVAVATAGVSLARRGRGGPALGLAAGLGLLLHRSALALLPAVVVALILFCRGKTTWERIRTSSYVLVPILGAGLLIGRRIFATMTGFDAEAHFASEDVRSAGGLLAASFAPRRLAELANATIFLTPLVGFGLAVLVGRGMRRPDRATLALLLTLAATHVGMALLVHPAQGVFRDWDVFAPAGISLAVLAAALVATALEGPKSTRRSLAVSLAFIVPVAFVLPWLVLAADATRSLVRVEAFVTEAPARTEVERAKTWDFLGAAHYRLGRPLDAARAFAFAAESARNPRLYVQQGRAAREGGDLAQAQAAYRRAVDAAPDDVIAWKGLGESAWAGGDLDAALEAARALAALAPGDSSRRAGLAAVERAIALRRGGGAGVSPPPR